MQIAKHELATRLGRLASAAALAAAVGLATVAAHAQATNPTQAPNVMGTTGATTSGAVTQGATQGMKTQDMQKQGAPQASDATGKAQKKAKKAKPATQ